MRSATDPASREPVRPQGADAAPRRVVVDRRAFAVLFLALTCVGLGQAILFAILPPAAREIGLTPLQVSIIFVVSASIWMFMSPFWGRRSDVVGRRSVILVGLMGFAASMLLLGTAILIGLRGALPVMLVYVLMIASRCVFAVFGSGAPPASQAYVADHTSIEDRTRGVSMLNAAFGLGQTLGPAAGAIFASYGVVAPLYFSVLLALLSAAAVWMYLGEDIPVAVGQHRETRERTIKFYDARVWPFFALAACLQAVRSTTTITLAFFLQDSLALNSEDTVRAAGVGFVALAVAGVFTQVVVVQRLRPTSRRMLRVGLATALAGFLVFIASSDMIGYSCALAMLGAGFGLIRPGAASGASVSVSAEEQGEVAGMTSSVGVIGNILGPIIGTSLYELTPMAPYWLNASIMTGALIFAMSSGVVRRVRG